MLPRQHLAIMAAVGVLFLAGCGGGYERPSADGASSNAPAVSVAPQATPVTATETEFSIALSRAAFTPGTYTFEVRNTGTVPHNLTIKRPGVNGVASPTVSPGGTGTVTVALQNGSYEL